MKYARVKSSPVAADSSVNTSGVSSPEDANRGSIP